MTKARGRAVVAAALLAATTGLAASRGAAQVALQADARPSTQASALPSAARTAASSAQPSSPPANAVGPDTVPPLEGAPDGAGTASAQRGRCASWSAERQPLFGDLHVHTSLSFDANALGVRNTPTDAYRFARGAEIGIQPYDEGGQALRRVRLDRPLDFAAVTDHAELFGELSLCQKPLPGGRPSAVCLLLERWPLLAYILVNSRMLNMIAPPRYSFCGEEGKACRDAAAGPWGVVRDAADEAYDRTPACSFTSLVAYEWSGGPGGSMTHRNVIFADEKVPPLPVSFLDEPTGDGLWRRLDEECSRHGCRYLTIPHNTNLSNGSLFAAATPSREEAEKRRRVEPLLEVIQHKGDSECRASAADEFCSFEKLPFARMEEQPFPFRWAQPKDLSFAREILGEGLRREGQLGLNPFRLGMIGATDTHLAAAGLADERDYPGHGAGGDTSRAEVPLVPDALAFNPGGLAGVWAEENSREAIFAALARRETWATSGPRIVVRFFGGFDLPSDLCERDDFAAEGYAHGVPMGGELDASASASRAPRFAVSALGDAGVASRPGTPLDRVQVVKLWMDGGEVRERVVDVARSPAPDDLDPATCAAPRSGSASLCAAWTDDEWKPGQSAVYYARVIEKPSCRWTGHLCAQRRVDCSNPDSVPGELAFCCDDATPKVVRERALTSPVWIPAP